ncbi:MAG: 4'-phosphopantetheinyl transferase superfamily protein [Candidatus Dormibacteraeota bacterium]|nr:4'-phosphopantetheinyl transferase superfamily protein [Candidatus Dormibacteraeota bacterium]
MIGWLIAAVDEVPVDDSWLVAEERQTLGALRIPKRRADWRLGRWAAKCAVGAALGLVPRQIEIRAAEDGAPEALSGGTRLPVGLSISHCSGRAAGVVATPSQPIGCDLEVVETRGPAFTDEWFTATERALVTSAAAEERDLLVTVIWSAKESALKAVRTGLRRSTHSVVVWVPESAPGDWSRLRVRDRETGSDLHAWWRRHADLVLSVAGPSSALPEPLR